MSPRRAPAPPPAPRGRDLLVVALSFTATLLALAAIPWAMRAELRRDLPEALRLQSLPGEALLQWRSRLAREGTVKTIFFGDSLAYCPGAGTVGLLVRQRLATAGLSLDVGEIRSGAFRPIVHRYHLAEVLDGRPALALLELNLRHLSAASPPVRSMRLESLSARLPVGDLWSVRAGLHAEGMSTLDPLVYRLLDALDLTHVAAGMEELGRSRLESWGSRANEWLGLRPAGPRVFPVPAMRAAAVATARQDHCADLTSRPAAPVIRDLVDRLRASGVAVIAYVSPVALHAARPTAPCVDTELPRHLEELRLALGLARDEWLDLHALVTDPASFRDADGHLHAPGCETVAAALAGRVRERLEKPAGAS